MSLMAGTHARPQSELGRERESVADRGKKERLCDHLAAELSCGVVTIGFKLGWKNKRQLVAFFY